MELRAFFTVERTCLPFWEFYLFSLVTLDRQFRTFGDLFAFYGYPGSAVPSFWGFICSLWLPWIGGLLLLGILSLALVTLNHRFPPFRDSFTLFGYPGSAVNKKRIGITPIPFLSRVSVYLFI